jgi:RNA polymerase sigma-70 factor (ECF subfamily)
LVTAEEESVMATETADGRDRVVVVEVTPSFDQFFVKEYPRMVALAYSLSGSRGVAEEIAQEAFLKAHRSWDRIASYDKPGAWLRRVTINLATSQLRRRLIEAKAVARLGRSQIDPVSHLSPEKANVMNAVLKLPRRQREAVVLHYLEDLPVAQAASILGVAETTLKTHLQRGREALARSLEQEGEL